MSLGPIRSDFTDDHVIEHFDFEQLPGTDQIASDFYVGIGRRWIAARVIVHQENGGSGSDDGSAKHFARVNMNRIEQSDADQVMADQTAAGVHQQHDKAFGAWIEIRMLLNLLPPVIGGIIRIFHLHFFHGAIPKGADAKLFRNVIFHRGYKKAGEGFAGAGAARFGSG